MICKVPAQNSHLKRFKDIAKLVNRPDEIVFIAEFWSQYQQKRRVQTIAEVTDSIENREFNFE